MLGVSVMSAMSTVSVWVGHRGDIRSVCYLNSVCMGISYCLYW